MSGPGVLNADMQSLLGLLGTGWRWWRDEMLAMVPHWWRESGQSRLALLAYQPEREELLPLISRTDRPAKASAPIAVVLPPELTLIRNITTPSVGERDLPNLVALDADRIMPFGRGEVLLGARVLARDAQSGRQTVEVAGLARTSAESLALTLARAGRLPARVLVSMPEPGQPTPIDLLPALRRAGLAGAADRWVAPLWLAVGFLFLLNIGLLVWRDAAQLDNLAAVVDQQQSAVNIAHGIIARMRREDAIAAATAAARRSHEPLALLAQIAAALPPGTWIQRFTWQGNSVQLAGFHPPKADVSGALRRAGLAVARYGDTSNEAATPLGEPFELTLRLAKR